MMRIIRTMRRQHAVFWEHEGTDRFGNAEYKTPVEIRCRWEDVHEMFLDEDGNEQVSNAKVYVDRETHPRGKLLRGRLDHIPSEDWREIPNGVFEIRKFELIPTLNAREFLMIAIL